LNIPYSAQNSASQKTSFPDIGSPDTGYKRYSHRAAINEYKGSTPKRHLTSKVFVYENMNEKLFES